MSNVENLTSDERIRATIYRDVRTMCIETCHFLGLEITKSAMEVVAELTYKKLRIYGKDLEAFAKHAKRNTINTEDVKLLVRRNPSLKSLITNLASTYPTKEKRRKTVAQVAPVPQTGTSAQRETAAQPTTSENPVINHDPTKRSDDISRNDDEAMVVDDVVDLTFD